MPITWVDFTAFSRPFLYCLVDTSSRLDEQYESIESNNSFHILQPPEKGLGTGYGYGGANKFPLVINTSISLETKTRNGIAKWFCSTHKCAQISHSAAASWSGGPAKQSKQNTKERFNSRFGGESR